MKTEQLKLTAALLAVTAGLTFNLSAGATLKVGDPAPKLQTGKWVQGEPVKSFEKGKAYIVEFWATWCPPCRASIPHLNEIYLKYKDKGLVVIGQNVSEQNDSGVAAFVKKMGDKMTYRVALDDKQSSPEGQMSKTWMEAAGQNGIPTAFLVDTKGNIAWIGHPMSLKEQVLENVLSGKSPVSGGAEPN
jgi:thiol-disulfide isomerase/thioredoxin